MSAIDEARVLDSFERHFASFERPDSIEGNLLVESLRHPKPLIRSAALTAQAAIALDSQRAGTALELITTATALVSPTDAAHAPRVHWRTLHLHGDVCAVLRRFDEAIERHGAAADHAWRFGLERFWARSISHRLHLCQQTSLIADLIQFMQTLTAAQTGERARLAVGVALAELHTWAGRPQLALEYLLEVPPDAALGIDVRIANNYLLIGEPQRALARLDQYGQSTAAHGHRRPDWRAFMDTVRAAALLHSGHVDGAHDQITAVTAELAGGDYATQRIRAAIVAAEIHVHAGRSTEAIAVLEEVSDELTPLESIDVHRVLVDAAVLAGDYRSAHHHREQQRRASITGRPSALQQVALSDLIDTYDSSAQNHRESRQRQLERSLVGRQQLTAEVAKDLRGPIFAIEVAAGLLGDQPDHRVNRLLKASTTVLELDLAALTDLDRLESASHLARHDLAVLSDLVESALIATDNIRARSTIQVDYLSEITISGDALLITRVIGYLFGDALHHSPANSRAVVETSMRGDWAEIRLRTGEAASAQAAADPDTVRFGTGKIVRERQVLQLLVRHLHGVVEDTSTSASARSVSLLLPTNAPRVDDR